MYVIKAGGAKPHYTYKHEEEGYVTTDQYHSKTKTEREGWFGSKMLSAFAAVG
jgi:hypothetical protein